MCTCTLKHATLADLICTTEPGYNAIEFEAAVNSWVRRVRITNADAGIKLYASSFNTISDVEVGLQSRPRRGGRWKGRTTVVQVGHAYPPGGLVLHRYGLHQWHQTPQPSAVSQLSPTP